MTEFATPSRYKFERLKWSTDGVINGVWGEDPNGVDDIPCARVADFDRLKLIVSDQLPTIRAVTARERANRVLQRGDLLIEKSGGGDNQLVGCVVSYDGDNEAICSNFIGRIRTAPEMYPRYWAYVHAWIYSTRQNIVAIKQTTGIQNLDVEAYLDIRVPYPSKGEQAAIAKFLDRQTDQVDTLVEAKQRLLDLLAEKRRAVVAAAVMRGINPIVPMRPSGIDWLGDIPAHWEVIPLRYLVSLSGGATPDTRNLDYWSGAIPWVSPKDMKRDFIDDAEDHVSEAALENSALKLIEPNAILIVVRGMILAHSFPTAKPRCSPTNEARIACRWTAPSEAYE